MFNLPDSEQPSDRSALQMYKNDFSEYIKMCKICVEKSQDQKFNNHPGSLIKLSPYNPTHDKIMEKIRETSAEEIETYEAKDELKNWLFGNFD